MSRLKRIKNSVEKNRDFDEARRILRNEPSIFFPNDIEFVTHKRQTDNREDITLISRDRGNGRASSGIKFLELISLSFTGKELDSLLKFDKLPLYVNPGVFYNQQLNDEDKVYVIARSLGVEELINIVRNSNNNFFNSIQERFLQVFNEVKEGTFRVEDSRSLLSFCRIISRTAINTNNIQGSF